MNQSEYEQKTIRIEIIKYGLRMAPDKINNFDINFLQIFCNPLLNLLQHTELVKIWEKGQDRNGSHFKA